MGLLSPLLYSTFCNVQSTSSFFKKEKFYNAKSQKKVFCFLEKNSASQRGDYSAFRSFFLLAYLCAVSVGEGKDAWVGDHLGHEEGE